MAACPSCGSELTGPYCGICGARAQETIGARHAPTASPKPAQSPRPVARARVQRRTGRFVTWRLPYAVAVGLIGLALFGAGMAAGVLLARDASVPAGNPASSLTSTAEDATLPALMLAGQYLDKGVEQMQNKEMAAAQDSLRKAITHFETALAEDSANLYARSYLGLTHFYAGDVDRAVAAEREVLKQDPDYLWAIFNLAWMYEATDRQAEAGLLYQKYLEAAPAEREKTAKYAEQYDLIERQLEAARQAVAKLQGGGGL